MRRGWRQGIGLALRDLIHDLRTTVVLMLTVAAIIAPLMLLFGLKNGVIATMIEDLTSDPRNLRVTVYGNTRLGRDWFEAYAQRPDVAFVVPRTRTINATIKLANADDLVHDAVELVPTAAGDPLLPPGLDPPEDPTGLLVTESLAEGLGIAAGDPVTGVVSRLTGGRTENALLGLNVRGILPETSFAGNAAFCHLDLLVATEDYRDGLRESLTTEDLSGKLASERSHFANARIYATDLYSVATVADAMRAEGIEVRTEAAIESVKALVRTLTFVFRVVALIGTLGGILALGGALWINVDRKRRNLALLRLYGFGNATVVLVPLAQSVVIAAGGFALAYVAYLTGAGAFNGVLSANLPGQNEVCRLTDQHLLNAAAAALGVALLAASAAGYRASRVDAAECLREV
jgi:putative ABC transport system permease protein